MVGSNVRERSRKKFKQLWKYSLPITHITLRTQGFTGDPNVVGCLSPWKRAARIMFDQG